MITTRHVWWRAVAIANMEARRTGVKHQVRAVRCLHGCPKWQVSPVEVSEPCS